MNHMIELRKKLGLTQNEAAEILKVTQPSISKMELRQTATIRSIEALAAAHGYEIRIELVPVQP